MFCTHKETNMLRPSNIDVRTCLMHRDKRIVVTALLWISVLVTLCSASRGSTLNEATRGDFSSDPTAPTAFPLTLGANAIIGTLGGNAGADLIDAFTITVPHGMAVTSYVNTSVSGGLKQAFTGFQRGFSFTGPPIDLTAYVGVAHFGLNASNAGLGTPSGSATSTVGVDLLPILDSEGRAVGASGFTPPLGQSAYTFLIGELNPDPENPKAYRFDFTLSAVPTPEPVALVSLLATVPLMTRRRLRQTRPSA
jgi:hypothetical protein